jgi:hypothetical protein
MRDIALRRETEARQRRHEAELAHISRVSLAGGNGRGIGPRAQSAFDRDHRLCKGLHSPAWRMATEPALLQEGMTEIVLQAQRASDVLDRLREFVRGGEFRREPTVVAL